MTLLKFSLLLSLILTPALSSIIYKEAFADNSYTSFFHKQCSYDDAGCNHHYAIENDENVNKLKVMIFSADKTHASSSPTAPRSELGSIHDFVEYGVEYVFTWNMHIKYYSNNYNFCFFQLFQEGPSYGPNVMIKWKRGEYELWVEKNGEGKFRTNLKGHLNEDLYQMTTWRIIVKMDKEGYIRVERKREHENSFTLLGKMDGETAQATDATHYLKLGIYSQQEHAENMIVDLNDLVIEKN